MSSNNTIQNLIKVELHRHLDCSMRFKSMLKVALELGLKIPTSVDEQRNYFLLTKPEENLGAVLSKFQHAQQLLSNEIILENLAFETVQEAAHENIKLLELRYSPNFIQQGHPNLTWDSIHQAFLRGIKKAQEKYAIAVGLILIIQRTLSLSNAESIVDFAINNKNTIVGIDLADDENGFNAKPFKNAFQRAKAAGLHITVHAGEIPNSQSITNIEESINLLGAERIGHGIQAILSPTVLKLLRDMKIPLEVCPTSNYLTQVIPRIDIHPLRSLFEENILLTINTDDPGIFDYSLIDELNVTHKILGFNQSELKIFQKTAFDYSFINENEKLKFKPLFI